MQQFRIFELYLFNGGINYVEDVGNSVFLDGPVAINVFLARVHVELDTGYPGPILAPIVLFLHQEVQFINAVEGGSVFFTVKIKGFEQPHEGYSAFVIKRVAHGLYKGTAKPPIDNNHSEGKMKMIPDMGKLKETAYYYSIIQGSPNTL